MNVRLRHDVAWVWATAGVEPVAHLLRPEEQKDLHAILYELAQAALTDFEERAERESRRLEPSAN